MSIAVKLRRHSVKALALGVINGSLLSAIMVPAFKAGVAPMPKPPSQAFAEVLMGHPVPLPAGLLLHLLYVTFWSVAYVVVAYPKMTFIRALALGLGLWVVALVVFFPIVGWGVLGLGVSLKLIPASLFPHLLFAVFLWGLARLMFKGAAKRGRPVQEQDVGPR